MTTYYCISIAGASHPAGLKALSAITGHSVMRLKKSWDGGQPVFAVESTVDESFPREAEALRQISEWGNSTGENLKFFVVDDDPEYSPPSDTALEPEAVFFNMLRTSLQIMSETNDDQDAVEADLNNPKTLT